MPVLETPSRVWRRIQAADDLAVPSLPSLPAIDFDEDDEDNDEDPLPSKRSQSTPSASISVKKLTTVRFAEKHESFEFSNIQPIHPDSILSDEDSNKLPPEYSVDISAQFTPIRQPLNKNIAVRTVRTPSLTRSASPISTPSNTTPTSDAQVSLANASRRSSTAAQPQALDLSQSNHDRSLSQSASSSQTKHSSRGEKSPSQTSKYDVPLSDTTAPHILDPSATPQAKKRSFLLDVIHSTAKPRPRLSMHTPAHAIPRTDIPIMPAALFATPKATVNDSFISTASSHDLTVQQPRINASFDHLTGAKGVGRFNATKLNNYLHGLNRRLVEENEELTNRLRQVQGAHSTITEVDESTRALEIAALESMVKDLESQLENEKQEKETERLKFKERVKEVEDGVNEVVEQLETQLEVMAESKEQALAKARRAQELREDAEERAHRAELALAKGGKVPAASRTPIASPTGSGTAAADHEEFKEAIERVAELEEELRLSKNRSVHLEEELRAAEEHIGELKVEKQASDKKAAGVRRQLEDIEAEATGLREQLQKAEKELEESKETAHVLLAELEDTQEELAASQDEANNAKVDVELLRERVSVLESRAERVDKEQRQLEQALEVSENKMLEDQEELASLRQELERLRLITSTGPISARASTNTAVSAHPFSSALSNSPVLGDIEGLEKELDDAHREIGRLQHLLRDSPARAALAQAKEAKIEALEGENVDLQEQVRTLRVLLSKGSFEGVEKSLRGARDAGASPSSRNLPSIRNPRTPGGPLRDLSWLQSAHNGDESPYLHQISTLERELAHANECVDDKIDKLNEYGRGVTDLTEKLHDAEGRIDCLQAEVQRLERREQRRSRQASRGIVCHGCGGTMELNSVLSFGDQSLCDASRAKDAVTDDSMKKILKQLEKMKQDWVQEKMRLQDERDHLQDAAERLGKQTGHKGDSNQTATSEAEQVKQHVADLESQLQAERCRLRELAAERSRMLHDKNDVAVQLQRTQADLDAVRDQLRSCKQENYALEADLRANAQAESKSRQLQNKVMQNQALIEQLREERDRLAESHSKFQRRHQSATENIDRLRKDLAATQSNHDERRHQLDVQLAEIDDLRREMALKDEELSYERRRNADVADLHSVVTELEHELAQMRQEANRFAQDLESLRGSNLTLGKGEVAKAERAQMQLRAQVRVLEEQLDEQKVRAKQLFDEAEKHVCSGRDDSALSLIKARHNQECKGLMLQINYLKNKYTRESTLRQHLAHQKEYLLTLLSQLQQDDLPILKSLAHTQHSLSNVPVRRLRSVVHIVMFLNRAKKAAERWAEQSAAKDQLAMALDDVRKRRLQAGRKSAPGIFN